MMSYPVDCIQGLSEGDWWVSDDSRTIGRGMLVWCHVQFFSQIPLQLVAERRVAQDHSQANMKAVPLSASGPKAAKHTLPVAALPSLVDADAYVVNRCKRRPCLVLGGANPALVSKHDSAGMAPWQTSPFFIVAPYYSIDTGNRGGFPQDLAQKIRHAHFRQYFWDKLPLSSSDESVLRFDQVFPVGHQHASFTPTGYRLSEQALFLLDQWLGWYIGGNLAMGELLAYKELTREEFY
jgi:hypothetical protein